MELDLIFKIAAIGIIVAVLNQLLVRAGRDDLGMLLSLAGLLIAMMMIISEIKNLFDAVQTLFGTW